MRGHICDMDALMQIAQECGLQVIEDCAHTMGAKWNGTWSGRHGVMGCYSCQTYKHVNSGEGGLLISDDPDLMARATMLSGSYMLYAKHRSAPPPEAFAELRYMTPNISGRMDNLRAAILRPQLRDLARQCQRWNDRYQVLDDGLANCPGLTLIERPAQEAFVASSHQFLLLDWSAEAIAEVISGCAARGVELKWFGNPEPVAFTSTYGSWKYAPSEPMPASDRILHAVMDMRLPLTFSLDDCALIARIIRDEVSRIYQATG